MGFREWLKGLFKIENLTFSPSFKLFSDNQKEENTYVLHLGGERTEIDTENQKIIISSRDVEEKYLPEVLNKHGIPILEDEYKRDGDEYALLARDTGSKAFAVVNFFNGILTNNDITILKAAVFVRKASAQNPEKVPRIRQGIIDRFGRYGNNMCNLFTAGHYTDWFIPMYEEMAKREDFTNEKFRTLHEDIVWNYPFAVFVSTHRNEEETREEIVDKINQMETYGIKTLYIHGIGEENIRTIRRVVDELIEEKGDYLQKTVIEDVRFISVKIRRISVK
ncbi:hypothetical protein JXA34_01445 [Patescibacteria group bacterium]|nr:hypothetical protein [Patescibacteria group bacterium]